MKKIIITLLILAMSLTLLASCGGDSNESDKSKNVPTGITFDDLQNMSEYDAELSLNKSGDGYTISGADSNVSFSGKTDSDKNVTDFSYVRSSIPYDTFSSSSELRKLYNKAFASNDPSALGDIPRKDMPCIECFLEVFSFNSLISDNDPTPDEVISLIADGKPITNGNWTISSEFDSTSCTVSLTYNG